MRMVNLSLQILSAVTQSGWKFIPEETKKARNANTDAGKVDDATRTAKKALGRLREITPDDLDVERAACSIAGKLITLELVRVRPLTVGGFDNFVSSTKKRSSSSMACTHAYCVSQAPGNPVMKIRHPCACFHFPVQPLMTRLYSLY